MRTVRFLRRHFVLILVCALTLLNIPQVMVVGFFEAFEAANTTQRESTIGAVLLLLIATAAAAKILRWAMGIAPVPEIDIRATYTVDRTVAVPDTDGSSRGDTPPEDPDATNP